MSAPAEPTHPRGRSPGPVVIRWVDPRLPHIWQLGHEIDGDFRPFAGGSSEEALRLLEAKERARTHFAGTRDRRQPSPRSRPASDRA